MNIVIPDDDPDMGDQRECYSLIGHHEVTRHREPARDPAQIVERGNCYAMSLGSPLAWRHAPCIMASQLRFEATQSRGAVMYVVVEPHGGWIFAFGATPEKADADYVRRDIWYDGPSLDTRRCSPALYRQLKAAPDDNFIARCRINSKGVAVLRSDRIGVLPLGRPRAIHLRKGQPCT
jgi:hypothetical protein